MQSSNIPAKSPLVFASSATGSHVRGVPQTSTDPGAASFTLGFPPQTFLDEGAGGTPPDGRDFNGVLQFLSAWSRWFSAGGAVRYDNAFQTAIAGYPKGAIVHSATTDGLSYISTAENNVTNPDAGGAGWVVWLGRRATLAQVQAGTDDTTAVTPRGLKDAGGVFVVSQNLAENNGWRKYSDGYMECWGKVTLPSRQTTVITYPNGGFTSWSNPTVSGVRLQDGVDDDNPGVVAATAANFSVWCKIDIAITAWWNARGY